MIVYLNDILIYTESKSKEYVEAVQWVLEQLQKHLLYTNLKKCWFHPEKVRFLGYIISCQCICIEDKQIQAVCDLPQLQSVHDIQIFLGFANFYRQFIQRFSKFVALLTFTLKTTLTAGPATSAEIGDEEQDGKEIQIEDRGEKKPAQKSCKDQPKG